MWSDVEVHANIFILRLCNFAENHRTCQKMSAPSKKCDLTDFSKAIVSQGSQIPGRGFSRCPLTSRANLTACFLLQTTNKICGSKELFTQAARNPANSF
jgi:hypothetical protein